jgi:hypothetical protein
MSEGWLFQTIQVHRHPKAGVGPGGSEDGHALNRERGLYAVTDGASTAPYSGLWARLLARAFVREPPAEFTAETVLRWLARPRRLWTQRVPWSRLDYFARRNADRGSFSTLVGLRLDPSHISEAGGVRQPSVRWRSLAVGDSCLFHIRGGRLVGTFPLSKPEEFQNPPYLLATAPALDCSLPDHLRVAEGEARPGDILALCTDALAMYVTGSAAEAGDLMRRLASEGESSRRSAFRKFVEQGRATRSLRNDDMTLVLLAMS